MRIRVLKKKMEEEEESSEVDWDEFYFKETTPSSSDGILVHIINKYKRRVWATLQLDSKKEGISVKDLTKEAFDRKGLINGENCHLSDVRTQDRGRLKEDDIISQGEIVMIRFYRFGGAMRFEPGEAALILPEDDTDPKSEYIYVKRLKTGHWNYARRTNVFIRTTEQETVLQDESPIHSEK